VQSIVAGTNLAVSKDSKHHDEALELVEFLTSTEVQRKLNAGLESLPVLRSLVGAKEFSDPARTVFGEIQANHSEPMPLVPDEGAMETALGTTLVKLWPKAEAGTLTDADIRTALRDAEALMPRT
jgi:multiple sugar transport system substrate-binding protein